MGNLILQIILPITLLILINIAVILRRFGNLKIPAWSAFLLAAVIISVSSHSSYERAIQVIVSQIDVFIFLFGMFIIVKALEISGVLEGFSTTLLNRAKTPKQVLVFIFFIFGFSASILINDTVAILGSIVLLSFTKHIEGDIKPLIISLMIAITFGSAIFPTGNPQNFILAINGNLTFLQFALYALIPVIIIILTSYEFIKRYYKKDLLQIRLTNHNQNLKGSEFEQLKTPAIISLISVLIGIIISGFFNISMSIPILIIVTLLLFFRNERDVLIKEMDWGILLFFGGMFVVIDAVVNIPYLRYQIKFWLDNLKPSFPTFVIFIVGIIILSQFISNVPVAILISQILPGSSLDLPIFWITAALATTFAGATSVLGAASNIIVIEICEKRGIKISWFEFTKVGFILTLLILLEMLIIGYLYFTFLF